MREWVENRSRPSLVPRLDARELWAFRGLARALAVRDLKLRYRQTAFGVAWAILQPLAAMAVFSYVFGRLADISSEGLPYPVFVFTALSAWLALSTGVSGAAESLVEHRELIVKTYFPRMLAPFAAVATGVVDLAVALVAVGVLMAVYGTAPTAAIVTLPLWIVAVVVTSLGAGLWLSALNALYRDVRYALPFLFQLWLFASPVVFPSSLVHGAARYLFALNPMVGTIDGFRWALIGAPAPPLADLVSLASGLALLIGGLGYFSLVERRLADRI